MNLKNTLMLFAASGGPGTDSIRPTPRPDGVVSMERRAQFKGRTRIASEMDADASPSDLASHHTWQEPSSTDVTIKNWQMQRIMEKDRKRFMDPFEVQAELSLSKYGFGSFR